MHWRQDPKNKKKVELAIKRSLATKRAKSAQPSKTKDYYRKLVLIGARQRIAELEGEIHTLRVFISRMTR